MKRLLIGTMAMALCASLWMGHDQHLKLVKAQSDLAEALIDVELNGAEVDRFAAAYHQCLGRYLVKK